MDAHRPVARARAGFVVVTALLLLVSGLPSAQAADQSSLAPVVESPPREDSPFTETDTFCKPDTATPPPNRAASAPGVSKHRITVVMLVPAVDPAVAATAPGGAPGDAADAVRTFGDLVNRCGGTLGRKLDIQVLQQTADPQADCLRAVGLRPFVVVSWTKFDGASCVADPYQTIMIASQSQAPNDTILTTQGRLAVGSTSEGTLSARVLDLIRSGKLDKKKVAVIASPGGDSDTRSVRQLLASADPNQQISIVGSTTTRPGAAADVVITTAFSPSYAQIARAGTHPITVYSLGDASDGELDAVRTIAGIEAAQDVSAAGVYGWLSPQLANYREDQSPSKFAEMCNGSYDAAHAAATTSTLPTRSTTTTTVSPLLPNGPYEQVAKICLAWRITARALYSAGPDLTSRSMVRALYRLPNIESVDRAPKARPGQVINEPVTRAGHAVFLAKAEYPCVHPQAQRDAKNDQMCWVPTNGWEDGHAVNAAR